MSSVDKQYLDIMRNIENNGSLKKTRSGDCLSLFGQTMRFNLKEGFPLLTTKKVFLKGIIYELLWFIKGDTNIKYLVENKVNIWTDDAYRYYLTKLKKHKEILEDEHFQERVKSLDDENLAINDGKILTKEEFVEKVLNDEFCIFTDRGENGWKMMPYTYGDLGPIYGKQMRNYGVSGRDQLQELIDKLKEDPNDRRMIICMWNSDVLDEIALPACHSFYQFYTRELLIKERYNLLCEKYKDEAKSLEDAMLLNRYTDIVQKCDEHNIPKRELSCSFYCRSQDFCLGTPYNIASASLLVHMIAQCVGMSVGELVWNGGDCHLYLNQLDGVKEQLSRDCDKYKSPQLKVNKEVNDINNFAYEDFEVIDYECYPSIKYPLSVGL